MHKLYILVVIAFSHFTNNIAFEIKPRIVNGAAAQPSDFPYFAFLKIITDDDFLKRCGGVLISDEWILTAGHCIRNADEIEVHLGSTNLKAFEEGHEVHDVDPNGIVLYPHYNHFLVWNDIGSVF